MSARARAREEKRRRIIDAAVQVFAEKGFHGAKVADIAETAGVADGTIYLYFPSKDQLLRSLFREKMAEILQRLQRILAEAVGPEDKLRRYIEGHLALVEEQPQLMQILTVELRQSALFMKDAGPPLGFARYLAVLAGIVAEGQKLGVFDAELRPAVVSRALFGAVDEISLSWVIGGGRREVDRSEVAAQIERLVLQGLLRR